jgi:hypothetical protein
MSINQNLEPVRVFAAIPSLRGIQLLSEGGELLPSSLWTPSDGTYEGTFSRIGRRVVGKALSVDWAHSGPGGKIYLAAPIDPDSLELREHVTWAGPELGALRYKTAQDYWRQLLVDVVQQVQLET